MGRPLGSKNKFSGTGAFGARHHTKAFKQAVARRMVQTRRRNQQAAEAAFVAEYDRGDAQLAEGAQLADVHAQLKANPLLWAKAFCPRHFRLPTPPCHLEMLRAVMQHRQVAIAAPRESSKSTLLDFVYVFHGLWFQRFRFIVLISNTFTKASMALDTMKGELRENALLRSSWAAPITLVKDAEGDSEFRHPNGFETKVLCRGVDQLGSLRGVKFGAARPDLIIGDDMEDDELVRNPERRRELQHLVDEALMPAGEVNVCQYIFIGTILHDDSQLAKMVKHAGSYPEFTKLCYQAHLDPGGTQERSLWPEKWSVAHLGHLRRDKPLVYAKEYQNDPVAGEAQRFFREDFRTWERVEERYQLRDREHQVLGTGALRDCKAAIACDLAWEEKRESDFSVVLPGFLTPTGELLVDQYVRKKGMKPPEIEEVLFSLVARMEALTHAPVVVGMERAKLEKVVGWYLREAMRRRQRFFLLKDLAWDFDKLQRIEVRLSPRYAQHVIYHRAGLGELEEELVRFPSGRHDDLADAAQGLVQLLQFPKAVPASLAPVDQFLRMRQVAREARTPPRRGLFSYTHPTRQRSRWTVPAVVSPLSG